MKTSIRFVPIQQWPGKPTRSPEKARFTSGYRESLDLLDKELAQVNARNVIVQAYFERHQLRGDGWPYSNARPSQSGLIVSFTSNKGALSFPCDKYTSFDDNLRAIALSLQALRAVDRYGVTQRAEQYQGWAQIEAPKPEVMTAEDAARFVSVAAYGTPRFTTEIVSDTEARKKAYRSAAAMLHPDNQDSGHAELFKQLQEAMAVLAVAQ